MHRQRIDSGIEKQLVLAMIVSDSFLAYSSLHLAPALLSSPQLRRIATWSFDYYKTYGKAPKREIEGLYYAWAEGEGEGSDEIEPTYKLLQTLSKSYHAIESANITYLQDQLDKYITGRRLTRLVDSLNGSMHKGNITDALREVQSFRSVDMRSEAGISPFSEVDVWDKAFEEKNESLLMFPGDAGKFLNFACTRDALIGIQAPEKRGKTFWTLEFMIQALKQRRRVALFEVGDLSEGQVLRRIAVRLTSCPLWQSQCGTLRVPRKLSLSDEGQLPKIKYELLDCPSPVSKNRLGRELRKFLRRCGIPSKSCHLLVSTHPTGTLSVRQIETMLDGWEIRRGFIPDVVIIDYADILAPEDKKQQSRDQVNSIWSSLRRLSQSRRCLVVAPTQADTESYDRHTQTMRNFSEDKRKLAHVTGMLGLNQTDDEKRMGLMRLNWIVLREAPFNARRCLWVGQCFEIGKALCCSLLDDNIRRKSDGNTKVHGNKKFHV